MTIAVNKMPTDPGPAAWNALLGPAKDFPLAEHAQTADFVIVGAGFAGLAAARRLRQLQPGATIVVLEARKIAEGPAGRNSGFMIDIPHKLDSRDYADSRDADLLRISMNREAIQFSQTAAAEFDMAQEAFDKSGKINAAAGSTGVANNQNYAEHLSNLGETHELLDAAAMRDICGSNYYQSGLFSPGTATIQPALFIRSLAAGLDQQGVQIYQSSPVTSLSRSRDSWHVETPKAVISAGKVILAVNGHIESFGFFKRQLMHIYLYASITRALTEAEITALGGHRNWAFTPADPLGTTVRKISGTGGHRILVRNRFTWAPGRSVSEQKIKSIAPVHDRSFQTRFPQLQHVQMEHQWGGLLCLSRNSAPAFGEIDTNLYSACCQNGLGTVMGTLSGKLAAELATDQNSKTLKAMLDQPQPSILPPEPFASIGANVFMRWSEFRAGREL